MDKKERVLLITGLLIPIGMIMFIVSVIYIPGLMMRGEPPKYDFLYVSNQAASEYQYSVLGGKLTRKQVERAQTYNQSIIYEDRFYIHSVSSNKSQELSYEEASRLRISSSSKSPDGFTIVYGRRGEVLFPFFSSRDYSSRYIKKNSYTQKLDLEFGMDQRYYYNFRFLGWLVSDGNG